MPVQICNIAALAHSSALGLLADEAGCLASASLDDALPVSGCSWGCRAGELSLTFAVDLAGPGTSGTLAASRSFPEPCDAEGALECAAC